MGFRVESPDFKDGDTIPTRFTCDGGDISPRLVWADPPEGTKSFVLTVEDPDAPMGTFIHWVAYDIPGALREIKRGAGKKEGGFNGAMHGRTDFGHSRYGGPCPPRGHGRHRYHFILRALDIEKLEVPSAPKKSAVDKAARGHVLAEARIMGVYER